MPSPRSLIVVNLPSLECQSWHEVAPNYIGYVQTVNIAEKAPCCTKRIMKNSPLFGINSSPKSYIFEVCWNNSYNDVAPEVRVITGMMNILRFM